MILPIICTQKSSNSWLASEREQSGRVDAARCSSHWRLIGEQFRPKRLCVRNFATELTVGVVAPSDDGAVAKQQRCVSGASRNTSNAKLLQTLGNRFAPLDLRRSIDRHLRRRNTALTIGIDAESKSTTICFVLFVG